MAEYIDREALRKVLESWRDAHADVDDEEGCGLLEDVIWEVDAQPAVDVAPVVHGRWISFLDGDHIMPERYYRCSRCSRVERRQQPHCHCGAKMDGGADNATD